MNSARDRLGLRLKLPLPEAVRGRGVRHSKPAPAQRAGPDERAGRHSGNRLEVEGGWYVILRVPVRGSDEELTISLLRETGVLVQPGHFYDFPGEGHLVLSLITPQETFAQGVERLLRFISEA